MAYSLHNERVDATVEDAFATCLVKRVALQTAKYLAKSYMAGIARIIVNDAEKNTIASYEVPQIAPQPKASPKISQGDPFKMRNPGKQVARDNDRRHLKVAEEIAELHEFALEL